MKPLFYLFTAGLLSLASCTPKDKAPAEIIGYAPIYQKDIQIETIKSIDPQPIVQGGKIYIKDQTLYQIETGKGIHVLDIHNPSQPVKLSFIQIAGAQEIAIKGNLLYANNYNDLVVINIENVKDAQLVKRTENVFHIASGSIPPEAGYYECVDPKKGPVVGWEKKMLYAPKCKS